MIDETLQDQAAMYVMRMLPPQEDAAFAQRLAQDEELKKVVADLETSAAALIFAAPVVAPPPSLKELVMAEARQQVRVAPATPSQFASWIPWALAAGFALAATISWQKTSSLNERIAAQAAQTASQSALLAEQSALVAELRNRDNLASIEIASLSTKVAQYEKALAVVVYDQKDQRGLVKVDHFPKAAADKDYQLWVIPTGGKPVSAGLVPVNPEGLAKVSFTPTKQVGNKIDAFAISVEPRGGSEQPRGDVVFVGR